MSDHTSYMICTAPRSGSTLLCGLLRDSGIAGHPASYFYDPSVEDWLADLGIDADGLDARSRLDRVFAEVLRRGRGGTAVFGLRQQRPSFDYLCRQLALACPEAGPDRARIDRIFGPTLFIYLRRDDKLAQAVSLLKARQSGLWHVAADGSELERLAPHQPPTYDANLIRETIGMLDGYDRGWEDWFAQQRIAPLRLSYADLAEAPGPVLGRVLDRLGLDPSAADDVAPMVRKLADDVTRDWIARYRAEAAASA